MAKKKPDSEPTKPAKTTKAASPKAKAEVKAAPAAKSAPAPVVAAKPAAPVVKVLLKPSKDEISKRAFEIWVAKGKPHGKDLENWHQAERELGA
jgi:hypothetical protein